MPTIIVASKELIPNHLFKGHIYLRDMPNNDRNFPAAFGNGSYKIEFIVFTKKGRIDELLLKTISFIVNRPMLPVKGQR